MKRKSDGHSVGGLGGACAFVDVVIIPLLGAKVNKCLVQSFLLFHCFFFLCVYVSSFVQHFCVIYDIAVDCV